MLVDTVDEAGCSYVFSLGNKIQLQLQQYSIAMLLEEVSSNQIHPKEKVKSKEHSALIKLGQNAINQLQLEINMADSQDVQQLSRILIEVLNYPNSELAELHSEAMRLGNFDLEEQEDNNSKGKRLDTSSQFIANGVQKAKEFCSCCGFVKQEHPLKICTSFNDIKNMGVSTYLYFSIYKNLAILLAIMTIIYSGFALATNVLASRALNEVTSSSITNIDYITISLSAKQTHDTAQNRRNYFIQCWLGLVTIIIWLFALIAIKYYQRKSIHQYDNDTISCPDYSIVIQGIPLDVKKEQLQKQMDSYYQFIIGSRQIPNKWKKPIVINKINMGKPFYLNQDSFKDQELTNINKETEELKQQIIDVILHRQKHSKFHISKEQRQKLLDSYQKVNKRKMQKLVQISKMIKEKLKEKSLDEVTTAFVTFQNNLSSSLMSFLHRKTITGRIKGLCGSNQDYFSFRRQNRVYELQIRKAPQPEDIIWTNIGQNDCAIYLKKLLTFTVTIVLLGVCFAIVFGLTKAQMQAGENRSISIAISVTISIVNIALGQVIRRLTVAEKDYTQTYRQSSLAIKSILAQMINTIVIPVVTAYQIKRNIYQTSGLVDNVFMLCISNAIVTPLVLLINPQRILRAIIRCLSSSPGKKLSQSQKQFNLLHEGVQFEVGYQSIYPITLFMYVCFFVSLQPIVPVIALFGYLLKYWIQKYTLFNRYKRPVPGTQFISDSIYRFIRIGPLIYSFGSLTWSNLSPNGIPPQALLPNLICIGFSFIIIVFPIDTLILGLCFSEQVQKQTFFEQNRIYLPNEYDRLNPATSEEGIQAYKKYIEKKKLQMNNLSEQKRQQIARKMMMNQQRGQMNTAHNQPAFGNFNPFSQPQPFNPFQSNMPVNFAPMLNNNFTFFPPPNHFILPRSMTNQPIMNQPPMTSVNNLNQANPPFIPPLPINPNQNRISMNQPSFGLPQNQMRMANNMNNNNNSMMNNNNNMMNNNMMNGNVGFNNNPLNMIMPSNNGMSSNLGVNRPW